MGAPLYEFFYGHGSANERLFLLVNHATSPVLDAVMPAVTFFGGSRLFPLYFALLALLSLVKREAMPGRYPAVYLFAFFLALGAEDLLKEFFRVPRPPVAIGLDKVRVIGHLSRSYSLPSGHAVFSFMTAMVLSYRRNWQWGGTLFLGAALVAWSRIYLGAHYPLDVVGGGVVGCACGYLVWKLYELVAGLLRGAREKKGR